MSKMTHASKLMRFLLVEDDDDHAQIILRTLSRERIANTIDWVNDGVKAIQFLKRQGEYQNAQLPDVILLDLKLPKKDGLEVLSEIKQDEMLRNIPVVMLTTSNTESDKLKAYSNYVNSYLVKPIDALDFQNLVNELNLYWGIWNQAPVREELSIKKIEGNSQ
jgi:CheY-like chemotaxis protein